VDLGPCTEDISRHLKLAIAAPAYLSPDERRAVSVQKIGTAEHSWQIVRRVAGLDGPVNSIMAEITLRGDRLTIMPVATIDDTARRHLACSVLLFAAGRKESDAPWKAVRLVKPTLIIPWRVKPLSVVSAQHDIPLPEPLVADGLPPGCEIVLGIGDDRATLTVPAADEARAAGLEHTMPAAELGPGDTLVMHLAIAVTPGQGRSPSVTASSDIRGPVFTEKKKQHQRIRRLETLSRLNTDTVITRLEKHWRIFFASRVGKSLTQAAAGPDDDLGAWLRSPLPVSDDVPLQIVSEPLAVAFDAFLKSQADAGRLPASMNAWLNNCESILAETRFQNGAVGGVLAQQWQRTYQHPLAQWWRVEERKMRDAARIALDHLIAIARQDIDVCLHSVTVTAISPDGTQHVVPLVELQTEPETERGDPAQAGKAVGLE
jgi:hypothetical protein